MRLLDTSKVGEILGICRRVSDNNVGAAKRVAVNRAQRPGCRRVASEPLTIFDEGVEERHHRVEDDRSPMALCRSDVELTWVTDNQGVDISRDPPKRQPGLGPDEARQDHRADRKLVLAGPHLFGREQYLASHPSQGGNYLLVPGISPFPRSEVRDSHEDLRATARRSSARSRSSFVCHMSAGGELGNAAVEPPRRLRRRLRRALSIDSGNMYLTPNLSKRANRRARAIRTRSSSSIASEPRMPKISTSGKTAWTDWRRLAWSYSRRWYRFHGRSPSRSRKRRFGVVINTYASERATRRNSRRYVSTSATCSITWNDVMRSKELSGYGRLPQ